MIHAWAGLLRVWMNFLFTRFLSHATCCICLIAGRYRERLIFDVTHPGRLYYSEGVFVKYSFFEDKTLCLL